MRPAGRPLVTLCAHSLTSMPDTWTSVLYGTRARFPDALRYDVQEGAQTRSRGSARVPRAHPFVGQVSGFAVKWSKDMKESKL